MRYVYLQMALRQETRKGNIMNCDEFDAMHIDDIFGLEDIRESSDILSKIKFDVTPRVLVEPRFQSVPEDLLKLKEITGYMFYVEGECSPPALMLLKIGKTDITSTIGKIDEIPDELIQEAVQKPVHPPVHGMYEITDRIKDWLRKELGL
jgi:hypothetical protein